MSVTRRNALRLMAGTAATTALALAVPGGAAAAAKRPNIVVILVDDMGFSDVGCFGSEIPTPNIDALAAGGVRFTQFYNNARCSPSRASLITGAYPHQAGLGHLEPAVVPESMGIKGKLLDRVVTFGEVISPAGYHTAVAGKWHMGIPRDTGPWQRGFDRSFVSPQWTGRYGARRCPARRFSVSAASADRRGRGPGRSAAAARRARSAPRTAGQHDRRGCRRDGR